MDSTVFIIGLDGLCIDIWNKLVDRDWLPHLSKVIRSVLPLRSTVPPYTAPAWTSIATGVNPGKHGVLDFWQRSPWWSVRSAPRKLISNSIAYAFWESASDQGKRVGIFNYPLSYPPRSVNGFWTSGMMTPSLRDFTTPPELAKALSDLQVDIDYPTGNIAGRSFDEAKIHSESLLARINSVLRNHLDIGRRVLSLTDRADLYLFVITATDRFLHYFWDVVSASGRRKISRKIEKLARDFWLTLDAGVSEWIELINPDTVILVSDHGFSEYPSFAFNVSEWLRGCGWLSLQSPQTKLAYVRQSVGRINLLRSLAHRVLPQHIVYDLRNKNNVAIESAIDKSRTLLFPEVLYGRFVGLRVNLSGREVTGIVRPEDFDGLCEEVIKEAMGAYDVRGVPFFSSAKRAAEVWTGSAMSDFPDVVLELSQSYGGTVGLWDRRLSVPVLATRTGDHDSMGILAFNKSWTPSSGTGGSACAVWDIGPISLHLLQVGTPGYMDGEVPAWIPGARRRIDVNPPRADWGSFQVDDEAVINRRLRLLGYLE